MEQLRWIFATPVSLLSRRVHWAAALILCGCVGGGDDASTWVGDHELAIANACSYGASDANRDCPCTFLRGDLDRNGLVNAQDFFALMSILSGQLQDACVEPGDVDANGWLGPTDAIRLREFVFDGGEPPAGAYPEEEASCRAECACASPPFRPNTDFHLAVVPNGDSGDVSIIDTSLNGEIARIALPHPVPPEVEKPVAMSRNGRWAFFITRHAVGRLDAHPWMVHRLDLETFETASVDLGNPGVLGDMEISPDDRHLIVSEEPQGILHVIDPETLEVLDSIPLCEGCTSGALQQLAFSDDGALVFAANRALGLAHVVDLDLGEEVDSFPTWQYSVTKDLKVGGRCVFVSDGLHPVRRYDVATRLHEDITLQDGPTDLEIIDGDVAVGELVGGYPGDHVLLVNPFQLDEPVWLPTESDDSRQLTVRTSRNELWTMQGGTSDVFDLDTLESRAHLTEMGAFRFPSFGQDETYFYFPTGNQVHAIHGDDFHRVTIDVGDRPWGVFMQGDYRVTERY